MYIININVFVYFTLYMQFDTLIDSATLLKSSNIYFHSVDSHPEFADTSL